MSSVDNRIVKMEFDNATFKKEALATKTSIEQVDAAVAKAGKGKGLLDMAGHMDTVRVKASAMQIAAVTAIANIANRAVDAGINIAKSLTIDPIKAGFDEYELKIKSIQTIMANTKGESLKSVTKVLGELNRYADKTVYNFGNMTDAIGKMTTAGIDLKTATSTVKGFHNMVALAGGDSFAAAGALEQFNQGLQAGVIKLVDWKSLQTRGLGSQALQKSFFETAKAMGTLKDVPVEATFESWTKANGGFNATLESGWLTADVATKSYAIMAGEFKTVESLMKQGFSEKTAKDMLATAKNAEESATKVRTLTAFMGTLKEQLGSGWSGVMEIIFGDIDEATELFSGLADKSGKFLSSMFDGIERVLKGWERLGGKSAIFKTISHVLSPIAAIFGRIGDAIEIAFGGKRGGSFLAKFSKMLERLTRPLNILGKLIRGDLTPLQALMRMFQWGTNLIGKFAGGVGDLIKPLANLVGIDIPEFGLLKWIRDLAAEIKQAINGVDDLIKKGASLQDALGSVDISLPKLPGLPDMALPNVGALSGLPDLNSMFSGFNTDQATSELDQMNGSLVGLQDEINSTTTVGDKAVPALQAVWDTLRNFFKGFDIEELMAAFNLAVLTTFLIQIGNFLNQMSKSFGAFANTGNAFAGILESAGDALGSFQTAARAKLILNIAIAVGILAVSLWLLSRIPMGKLATGLAGLTAIMLIMKVGVNSIADAVEQMDGKATVFKLTALSFALLALGAAVLMLAGAFLILNYVDWSSMLKGLVTIVVVMKMMEKLGNVGEHGAKNLLGAAVALGALAISMTILAGALLLFKLVDWESIVKGGVVLAGLTASMWILASIPDAQIAKVGLAMLAASVGLLAIANAMLIFGLVPWESIGKGAVALALLTASLAVLQFVGNPVAISGLIGLGLGMLGLATAMLVLNKVDWESIGKAGVILLGLIAAFALFMAIVYVAAPVLPLLTGLALSLALLAGAIALMTLAFAAILPLMAIGVGAFAAFATGAAVAIGVFLTTLALQAPIMKKSVLIILQTLIDTIVEAVPMVIDGFQRLFAAIKKQFSGGGEGGGKMQASMSKSSEGWITKLADGIKKKIPLIVDKAIDLMVRFISALSKRSQELGAKGAELVANLINGVASRIDRIVEAATNLIIKFAEGIANNASRILKAGVKLIADFLHDLADTIRSGSAAIGGGITDVVDAMRDVGVDLVKGLISGLESMVGDALAAISDLASDMISKAKGMFEVFSPSRVFRNIGKFLVEGLTIGIQKNAASAITATASMVSGSIAVASAYVSDFVQRLDQQAIAAQGKALGLQRAAEKAAKAAEKAGQAADKAEQKANKTKKNKADDKAANRQQRRADKAAEAAEKLGNRANRADRAAVKAEEKAALAAERAERNAQFAEADTFDKAKMRSEDAAAALDAAKLAETRAQASLSEAAALEKQAKADGVTKKQRKEMLKQAEQLRKQAELQAKAANEQIKAAQTAAGDALALQKLAGDEAAAAFQKQFEDEAAQDAAEEAFEKLSAEEKAAERRRQAAALQAEANKDLQDAKQLAYSDLDAANELAAEALEQADRARQYLADAVDFDQQAKDEAEAAADKAAQGAGTSNVETSSRVVNLDPTEAASIAFNKYNDLYSDAAAAAAGGQTVEFNQYNTSPESLSPSELYRQTNNVVAFAAAKLQPTP